jgi:DNA-binding CsgD family transcriptional regulator
VAALACLGFTNQEIANRLMVSINTVRTHMRNVLAKFEVKNRVRLRQKLAEWDFSAWTHWV